MSSVAEVPLECRPRRVTQHQFNNAVARESQFARVTWRCQLFTRIVTRVVLAFLLATETDSNDSNRFVAPFAQSCLIGSSARNSTGNAADLHSSRMRSSFQRPCKSDCKHFHTKSITRQIVARQRRTILHPPPFFYIIHIVPFSVVSYQRTNRIPRGFVRRNEKAIEERIIRATLYPSSLRARKPADAISPNA